MTRSRTLALTLVLVACPPHEDDYTPQIRVVPGAANRINMFASKAQNAEKDAGESVHPARVHVMAAGDVLGGPNVIGRAGDVMIENDEVVFVIDQIGSSSGFAESGGNLVDAADARARKDELGQMFTYFGTFPRQGVYESLETGVLADGTAWALAKGHELYEKKLAVTTRYELHAGDRAMLITTTLENEGDQPVSGLTPGDAIQWGGAEKFSPDRGKNFKGPSSGAFLGGVGRFASYAIAATSGDLDAVSGPSWSDTIQGRSITIAPGKQMQYARIFLVGPRADTAGLVAELSRAAGEPVGQVELTLADVTGALVKVPERGAVEFSNGSNVVVMDAWSPGEAEKLAIDLPPGRYSVAYAGGGGRAALGAKPTIEVEKDKVAKASVGVSAAGKLSLQCTELAIGVDGRQKRMTVPCKATLEGVGATRTPEFGPSHVAGAARNQITMTSVSPYVVDVAPGRYRVTLSRGPEYALTQFEIDVAASIVTDACLGDHCMLTRAFETRGYVAADFHQHTSLGVDAPTSTRDRVIGNVAEGVEVAMASEHNVIADLGPVVSELGMSARLVSIPGDELTTDASRRPWGHANAFPLVYDASKPRGGALAVRDHTAHDLFEQLRKSPTPFVLQINHPRTGITGYFDQYDFDRKTGRGSDPGYDDRFDALEVWNGRNVQSREPVLADFFALLRTGHPTTATADTDTHGIVTQEAGYPRTYVHINDDAHMETWDAARTEELVRSIKDKRDVVLTNGPFLVVTANGVGIGGVAKAKNKMVDVAIEVRTAPWVKVDRVRVRRANGPVAGTPLLVEQSITQTPFGAGTMARAHLTIEADRDDAFVVEASGHESMSPVLPKSAGGDDAEIAPYAMTGAIWIDADGDGRSLGR